MEKKRCPVEFNPDAGKFLPNKIVTDDEAGRTVEFGLLQSSLTGTELLEVV